MTPSEIREKLECGSWEFESDRPPVPPEEWGEWKRSKMVRKIQAAHLFLKGKGWKEVCRSMKDPGMSRQRVHQLVKDGCEFLVSRRWVRPRKRSIIK